MQNTFETVTHADIVNGDIVIVQGYAMRASNVRTEQIPGVGADWRTPRAVVRFEGEVVDRTCDIAGTAYDGGTYGALPTVDIRRQRA
jgi:type 1 fimbria pilin